MNFDANKPRIIQALLTILERPGMYQINKIEDLNYFILGFTQAYWDELSNSILVDLRRFVNERFQCQNDVDIFRLIRFHSAADKHSMELFESILKDFLNTPSYRKYTSKN